MINRHTSDDLCRVVRALAQQRNELERLRYRVRVAEAMVEVSKRSGRAPFGRDSQIRKLGPPRSCPGDVFVVLQRQMQ